MTEAFGLRNQLVKFLNKRCYQPAFTAGDDVGASEKQRMVRFCNNHARGEWVVAERASQLAISWFGADAICRTRYPSFGG